MPSTHAEFDRIVSDPAVLEGQPCISGHRLTVARVLMALSQAEGNLTDVQRDYPSLEPEDIRQALAYASLHLDERLLGQRTAS